MSDWLAILAQRDDGDGGWIRLLFGALVVIFWLFSAFATWLNKRREEERRRRVREQLDRGGSPGVRVGPSPVSVRGPADQRAEPVRVPPQRRQQPAAARRVSPPPAAPPAPPQRAPQRKLKSPKGHSPQRGRAVTAAPQPAGSILDIGEVSAAALPVTATEISGTNLESPSAHAASANAAAIGRWLRPQTLRQQFILTEILQRPLALRDRERDEP